MKDTMSIDWAGLATAAASGGTATLLNYLTKNSNQEENNDGLGYRTISTARGGRKRFKISKLINSVVKPTEQVLCVKERASPYTQVLKHPVSEYNIGTGGFMGICKDSEQNCTPMHVYELNTFVGSTEDHAGNYPVYSTAQCNDANARAWWWGNDNKFYGLFGSSVKNKGAYTNPEYRYIIDDPDGMFQDTNPASKIFRKSIAINYMLYGSNLQALDYDIRVIRVTKPYMCPDYYATMTAEELQDFQQGWQNLIRAWCINPMLGGVEPGPKVKPWFKTVAKKRVRIGELAGDAVTGLPAVRGKIYVKLNEVNDYAWNQKGYATESGDAAYDKVPLADDTAENNTFFHKPYYTSRYYLVIRCTGTTDQKKWDGVANNPGEDGYDPHNPNATGAPGAISTAPNGWFGFYPNGIIATATDATNQNMPLGTQGSYDLTVQTYFLTMAGNG